MRFHQVWSLKMKSGENQMLLFFSISYMLNVMLLTSFCLEMNNCFWKTSPETNSEVQGTRVQKSTCGCVLVNVFHPTYLYVLLVVMVISTTVLFYHKM